MDCIWHYLIDALGQSGLEVSGAACAPVACLRILIRPDVRRTSEVITATTQTSYTPAHAVERERSTHVGGTHTLHEWVWIVLNLVS